MLQEPRRSSRANAGKRDREEGFVGDPKRIIADLIHVVAVHAVTKDCSIAAAIKAQGQGYLDRRQHEGCVRRAIGKLKVSGAADSLRAAVAEDICAATAAAMVDTLPSPVSTSKKVDKDANAPDWATLPGPEAGGERYRVSLSCRLPCAVRVTVLTPAATMHAGSAQVGDDTVRGKDKH